MGLFGDAKLSATVLGPSGFARSLGSREFSAEAYGLNPVVSNALGVARTDTVYFPRLNSPMHKGDRRTHGGVFALGKLSGTRGAHPWSLQAAARRLRLQARRGEASRQK